MKPRCYFFERGGVKDKLRRHVEFGERVGWDYASDDENDAD